MSSSLPCILTSVSGVSKVIKDGYNGFFVDQKDVDALTCALSKPIDGGDVRIQNKPAY